MKYALALLLILALGFFASQAVKLDPVHGYEASIKDNILLQNIYNKINHIKNKNPAKLEQIENKLPQLFSLFQPDSQESYILHEIWNYILTVKTTEKSHISNTSHLLSPSKSPWSDEIIIAIGEEIKR